MPSSCVPRCRQLLQAPVPMTSICLSSAFRFGPWCRAAAILFLGLAGSFTVRSQAIQGISNDQLPGGSGPVKLSQPAVAKGNSQSDRSDRDSRGRADRRVSDRQLEQTRGNYRPSEFELFVRQLAGITRAQGERLDEDGAETLRRFGTELLSGSQASDQDLALEAPNLVPDDYVIGPGDEVIVNLWGSVEANLRLEVDRGGRIALPRVGTVSLTGVRYADLRAVIAQRVAAQFRNFDVAVSLGQVRAVRVYVTGFVQRPGGISVSGLSTVLRALLAAGGPTAVGTLRNIQLKRAGAAMAQLDLYDLLLRGDRNADRVLRNDDVIHVGPVGPQVGVIGSVNKPAVFELRSGETVADVLAMAGGLSAVANRSSAVVHRLDERNGQAVRDVDLVNGLAQSLSNGDVLRVLSVADVARPALRQNKRVRVEGEVQRPGDYLLPPNSSLRDAVAAAGGTTREAYLFATEFTREAVRLAQIENYERALRDLETEYTRAAVTRKEKVAPPADDVVARNLGQLKLIERLRSAQPSGRVVLPLIQGDQQLPELAVEDGDRIYVPAKPSTVNVYGSVFNAGSYVFAAGRSLDQYLGMAGGAKRSGDKGSMFVIRANGSVVSNLSNRGWNMGGGAVEALQALPGDTVFVPEDMFHSSATAELKDWANILYQFGLGALALKNLK